MKFLIKFFSKPVSDMDIIEKLGYKVNIRNGVGYGFVSDEFLYNNQYLELGVGRVTSGYGDWGGGASYSQDSPLKIIIDKDLKVVKVDTASFYNSKSSQDVEKIAKKLKDKIEKNGLIFKHENLINLLAGITVKLPAKSHIGLDTELSNTERCEYLLDCLVTKNTSEYRF